MSMVVIAPPAPEVASVAPVVSSLTLTSDRLNVSEAVAVMVFPRLTAMEGRRMAVDCEVDNPLVSWAIRLDASLGVEIFRPYEINGRCEACGS